MRRHRASRPGGHAASSSPLACDFRDTPVDSPFVSTLSRRSRTVAAAAALVVLLVAGAAPVFAHAELVSSDPADGAQLATSPATITLTFSEGVVGKSAFNLILNGQTIGTGKAANDGDTTMTLGGLSLEPGAYTIQWTSVADDGDLLRGTIKFTVLQGSAPSAPASPTVAPSAGASDAASSTPAPTVAAVSPSPQASADTAPASSSGNDVLLPIVIGLLIVAGVGAILLQRSRRA